MKQIERDGGREKRKTYLSFPSLSKLKNKKGAHK